MITINLNANKEYQFDLQQKKVYYQRELVQSDLISIGANKYHVIINHQSYTLELLSAHAAGKELSLSVNGKMYAVKIKDQYDELLQQLGLDKVLAQKSNDVKAPMPGLVLRLMVEEGQHVNKGDALLVLEAMKMENVIKATGEGVVKKIQVAAKQTVDKNQVMILLE